MNVEVDVNVLVELLLPERWQKRCKIIPDYIPPFPREDTRPECRVCWERPEPHGNIFLRYSKGPSQGFFWDCYGDDMQSVELAIIALSRAPHPSALDGYPQVFSLPLREKKESE